MGFFHLLHHEHQARYDRMFPSLWAFVILTASAGLLMDTPANILHGLYTIVITEDALITDYVLVAGPGAALVNSAIVTAITVCVLYLSRDTLNGMTLVEIGLMSGFSLFGKNFVNIWPILAGTWLYTKARREPAGGYMGIGLMATALAPIVSYIAGSVAFGTLLYCSFLKGVPLEIEEAAQIDGCTPFQTFWQVTFPLLGPCTASMVVLNGLNIWNDFLLPYLALPSNMAKTITVEVYSFVGQYTARWDIVFAGTVCSIVPALAIFILLQKYFVKGITAGAAKG